MRSLSIWATSFGIGINMGPWGEKWAVRVACGCLSLAGFVGYMWCAHRDTQDIFKQLRQEG